MYELGIENPGQYHTQYPENLFTTAISLDENIALFVNLLIN